MFFVQLQNPVPAVPQLRDGGFCCLALLFSAIVPEVAGESYSSLTRVRARVTVDNDGRRKILQKIFAQPLDTAV